MLKRYVSIFLLSCVLTLVTGSALSSVIGSTNLRPRKVTVIVGVVGFSSDNLARGTENIFAVNMIIPLLRARGYEVDEIYLAHDASKAPTAQNREREILFITVYNDFFSGCGDVKSYFRMHGYTDSPTSGPLWSYTSPEIHSSARAYAAHNLSQLSAGLSKFIKREHP